IASTETKNKLAKKITSKFSLIVFLTFQNRLGGPKPSTFFRGFASPKNRGRSADKILLCMFIIYYQYFL
ncbi:MAG: hypothetical protein CMQ55_02075, partial [Gammaproteobacteria bacterium]|nr:hypothetical protein [Gammaproteobacteria bacterium]